MNCKYLCMAGSLCLDLVRGLLVWSFATKLSNGNEQTFSRQCLAGQLQGLGLWGFLLMYSAGNLTEFSCISSFA